MDTIIGQLEVGRDKNTNTLVYNNTRVTNLTAYIQAILENLDGKEVEVIVTPTSISVALSGWEPKENK